MRVARVRIKSGSFYFSAAPAIEKGDSLPFLFISESADELKDDNKIFQGQYVAAIIKAQSKGNARVSEMWKTSGLTWEMFMDKSKVPEFVAKNVSSDIS
jgi:hypothetical protein